MAGDTYTHGHQDAVLRSHRWRTAQNSAAYLLPYLAPGQRLLDVGCGPGTLTVDLARIVTPGRVVGVDLAAQVLDEARVHATGAGVGGVRPRLVEHGAGHVHADHLTRFHDAGEVDGERARPAPHIEHPLTGRQVGKQVRGGVRRRPPAV